MFDTLVRIRKWRHDDTSVTFERHIQNYPRNLPPRIRDPFGIDNERVENPLVDAVRFLVEGIGGTRYGPCALFLELGTGLSSHRACKPAREPNVFRGLGIERRD